MARTAATTGRAPRGTKVVADAFFSAVEEIPESQQAGVAKAALTMIRDRMKDARERAKLAKDRLRAKGTKTAAPQKKTARPKAEAKVAKKPAASPAKAKKAPAKEAAKRGRGKPGPRTRAMQPASISADRTPVLAPDDDVAV